MNSRRTRKSIPLIWIPALSMLLITAVGCMTVGRQFPIQGVHTIRIGETTRADVTQTFGAPWRTGLDDGRKTWTYAHYRYRLFGNPMTRDLVVRFDEQGVVVSYTFNSSYPEDAPR